jgi:hypothetical protein
MELTRKDFLVLLVGSAAAACGGSSSSPTPSGNCAANGSTSIISQNTGHVLNVTKADIAAGAAKTYDIQGTDTTHTHSVTLTAADMVALQGNLQALETSTAGNAAGQPSHTHQIQVVCV